MAETAANVRVGVNGAVYHAPTNTTLPTTATATRNVAFKHVGYVSEEGVKETQATETNQIKAWGGDVVRKIQTSHDVTYQFTMLETNDETAAVFYGDGNTAASVEITGDQLGRESYVLEVLDGDHTIRIVIPDGQVTERGEIQYVSTDAVKYSVTITCYPDANGVKAYKYSDAGGVS